MIPTCQKLSMLARLIQNVEENLSKGQNCIANEWSSEPLILSSFLFFIACKKLH
jgi:hypothetical protein